MFKDGDLWLFWWERETQLLDDNVVESCSMSLNPRSIWSHFFSSLLIFQSGPVFGLDLFSFSFLENIFLFI